MTTIISAQVPRKFDIEVSRGAIPGYESIQISGNNPDVGKIFEDVWDVGGTFVYPTAGETWEVLSDNANDSAAGTGARSVLISGLDVNYTQQTEIVSMNGTTPALTTRTDWFRDPSGLVMLSGSSQHNEGNITIRVSGGGTIRSLIRPELARTFNGFFTVPANKVLIVQQAIVRIPKDEDITLRTNFLINGSNTFITGGDIPIYQNQATSKFTSLPALPEKTDFRISVKSNNPSVSVAFLVEGILANGTIGSNSLFSM